MTRTALPPRRPNETREFTFADRQYSVCVGYYLDGRPAEVFADGPKAKVGSDMRATISDACVLISIALQNGVTVAELQHSLGRVPRWTPAGNADGPASIIGAILEAMQPADASGA